MTENLLLKLEEKTMVLLSEVDELRTQVQVYVRKFSIYRRKEASLKKIRDLIGLLDTVSVSDNTLLHEYSSETRVGSWDGIKLLSLREKCVCQWRISTNHYWKN